MEKRRNLHGLPQKVRTKRRNENWEHIESIIGWEKCLMLWTRNSWAGESPGLTWRCPQEMSLQLLSSPSEYHRLRWTQKQGATRQRGCAFRRWAFNFLPSLFHIRHSNTDFRYSNRLSGTGIGGAQGRKLLKHRSNFKALMDNHIC